MIMGLKVHRYIFLLRYLVGMLTVELCRVVVIGIAQKTSYSKATRGSFKPLRILVCGDAAVRASQADLNGVL